MVIVDKRILILFKTLENLIYVIQITEKLRNKEPGPIR